MNEQEVIEILFDEFGHKQFKTRDISDVVMTKLTSLLEIDETNCHKRNTRVGREIGALEGNAYTIGSDRKVKIAVQRPENKKLPRVFRLASSDPSHD